MYVRKVAVVGAGTMGHGIAEVIAFKGRGVESVLLKDVDMEIVKKGIKNIGNIMDELIEKSEKKVSGTVEKLNEFGIELTEEQKEKLRRYSEDKKNKLIKNKETVMKKVSGTVDYKDFNDVDFVIEAVYEDINLKKKIFREMEEHLPPHALLATNTSSLSITEIASSAKRGDRVIGMHFFNPPYILPLVEIIPAFQTSEDTLNDAMEFATEIGKVPVKVKEVPGFLVNRILGAMLNEAGFCLEEGVASMRDIDLAMKAGAGMPMGPFELMDMVGLDVCNHVGTYLMNEYCDPRYKIPPGIKRLVKAGRLGKKVGKGFYEY